MFKFGNTFGGRKKPQTEMITVDAVDLAAAFKEGLERTKKMQEAKTAELAEARSALEQRKRIVGEKLTDGEDASAEVHAMEAAESLVTQLEAVAAVATQRDLDVQAAFKKAVTAGKREALREKLLQLADLGRTVDAQWAENGQLAAKAITLIGEVKSCAFGDSEINGKLVDAILYFRRTLRDTCEAMPGCWTGEDLYKTRRPWSSSLPTPEMADRVK